MQQQMEAAEAEHNYLQEKLNPPTDWQIPDFSECKAHKCVHCWKSYVSEDLVAIWLDMSGRQRLILAANFDDIASRESWE